MKHPALISLVLAGIPFAHGGDVDTVRASFTRSMNQVDAGYTAKAHAVKARYLAFINREMENSFDAGNLDRVLWFREEKAAFEQGRPVAETPVVSAPVIKAGKDYRRAATLIREAKSKSGDAVKAKYAAYLERLTRRLTREGRIEEALAARHEADRLRAVTVPVIAPGKSANQTLPHQAKTEKPKKAGGCGTKKGKIGEPVKHDKHKHEAKPKHDKHKAEPGKDVKPGRDVIIAKK